MPDISITYGKVQVFDGVVPPQLYAQLLQAMPQTPWFFGWTTNTNRSARYWHHEVGRSQKDNEEDISHNVRKHRVTAFADYMDWLQETLVPPGSKILRFYLNAHTYGTDGWPHTDTDRNEELTAILYLNEGWQPAWCGETVVFDAVGDIEAAVMPKPNRLVTFPSDRLHAPRPLSKVFNGLRIVLVVKMAPPGGKGAAFNRAG